VQKCIFPSTVELQYYRHDIHFWIKSDHFLRFQKLKKFKICPKIHFLKGVTNEKEGG